MRGRRGRFTLVELLFTSAILAIVVTSASSLALAVYRNYMISDAKARFDLEIITAQEWIKRDLTASARGDFLLWPQGQETNIEAMSLPVLRRNSDSDALFDDATDQINWTHTVVYHIYETKNGSTELRRTVFEPRISLSLEERIAQLNAVYEDGDGSGTFNSDNSSTQTLLSKLTDYRIVSDPAQVDTYDPSYSSRNYYSLGAWQLKPGMNKFQFTVSGANDSSSGTDIALDEIMVSATGLAADAECLKQVSTSNGSADLNSMAQYAGWRNNAELLFAGGGEGDHVTLGVHNDSWIESVFVNDQAQTEDTEITYDGGIGENVCQLVGMIETWEATTQSLNSISEDGEERYNKSNIRVLISGREASLGSNVSWPGQRSRVTFRAGESSISGLNIREAYIMEQQDGFNGVSGTAKKLQFSGQDSIDIPLGQAVTSDFCDLEIDSEKNYLVSYYIDHEPERGPRDDRPGAWYDSAGRTNSYIYQAKDEDGEPISDNIAGTESWDGVAAEVKEAAVILGVEDVGVSYPEEGDYVSRIVDTRQSNPNYYSINWRESVPSHTRVEIAVRSGAKPDMSDAVDWDDADIYNNADGANSLSLQDRYVQWRAKLISEVYDETPKLQDVEIRWEGKDRTVDVGVNVAKGPDRGIFQLKVNDLDPQPAQLGMFFTLGQEVAGELQTRSFSTEVKPRN
ncbi:MAG: PulJ/GspJ family protein [Verrucomicrobiota bacterium]